MQLTIIMHAVVCCFFLLVAVDRTLAKPKIVSSPDMVTVYTDQAVMFRCQVYEPQNSLMTWSKVTDNVTISLGSRVLVQDNRFSVISVAGGLQYNLQILNVRKSDQGSYKCAIEGTDQELISQLQVLDMPTEKPKPKPTYRTTEPTTGRTTDRTTDRTTPPPEIQTTTTPSRTQTTATLPETPTTTSYNMPTGLMVIQADGSADVLLTWDMEQGTVDTQFTVFYKSLSEVQYTVVSDIATTYYHLKDLTPGTFYTAYVVARRSGKDSPPSRHVMFASGSKDVPNDDKDKSRGSGDDSKLILGIGIGVTVAAVILITMALLIICFICRERMKESITFAHPDFTGTPPTIKELQISAIKA